MLNYEDRSAIAKIHDYLEDVGFRYVNQRITDMGISPVFADFIVLRDSLKQLNPLYQFLFSIFRQGHISDEDVLRQVIPSSVIDAMITTGLLVQNERKHWQTPGLLIIPVEGLYLLVSTPPHYPTAISRRQPVYLGADSMWLLSALPSKMTGRRVLDICSGSGIQGFICAARGASKVVCLEKSEEAINISRFNAELNRLSDIVEVRQSDIYSGLSSQEEFDFFVTNPPCIPISEDIDFPLPRAGGADGVLLTRKILEDVPNHLMEEAEGYMLCVALGDKYTINFNQGVLRKFAEDHAYEIRAWVYDKTPISNYMGGWVQQMIALAYPSLSTEEHQRKTTAWYEDLKEKSIPAEYVYTEVIRFRAKRDWKGMVNIPIYDPLMTDPLIANAAPPRA